ncbi:MAG TPA: hypothetical protein ENI46_02505, partial [Firmicutes bacterium]|nr:hypothetical protein [Bacillota bacterium]
MFAMKAAKLMLLSFAVLMSLWGFWNEQSRASVMDAPPGENELVLTLTVSSYEVLPGETGVRLRVDDAGYLGCPGKPALPVRRFLIALPPGTRACSVELIEIESLALEGFYHVEPAAFPIPLVQGHALRSSLEDLQHQWQTNYEAVYGCDDAFPKSPVWLSARGTYRNYSYAAIAFCPFSYFPKSGRLIYHPQATVRIIYEKLRDEAIDPTIAPDSRTQARASSIFENYAEIRDLYSSQREHSLATTYDYVIIT